MTLLEPNRPLIHFTPTINWMNDPNGLLWADGEYHLFFQHNPYSTAWGHMSWGHAVSHDLAHWRHLPVAILEEPAQGYTIFSGSAVMDALNTSGFGKPGHAPMVAIYTADHQPGKALEDIHIAYSLDGGRAFTQYAGNPVIRSDNPKFGDPKVFWHAPSRQWILAAIHGAEQGWLDVYTSLDLKHWRKTSEFHAPDQAPGIWECPDVFPLAHVPEPAGGAARPAAWVLKVNAVTPDRGPVVTRYWVGDFDGQRFHSHSPLAVAINPDHDHMYAEITYNDLPAAGGHPGRRCVQIGWIRQTPDDSRIWTGMQSIPRELSLRQVGGNLKLCQAPVVELQALRTNHRIVTDLPLSGASPVSHDLPSTGGAWELVAEFHRASDGEFGIQLHLAGHASARIGYSSDTDELLFEQLDRRLTIPMPVDGDRVRLHVFVDRGVVEVFGGDGEATLTTLLEPETACTGLDVYAEDGDDRLIRLDVWELRSIWAGALGARAITAGAA